MSPERLVLSFVASVLIGWFVVILFLGWIGRVGVKLHWWEARKPLNLPRRP